MVRSVERILSPRECNPARGPRGSRAASVTAKAMDGVKSLEEQRPRTPRGQGSGTIRRWTQELEKSSPARQLRSGGARRCISGEPREVAGQPGGWGTEATWAAWTSCEFPATCLWRRSLRIQAPVSESLLRSREDHRVARVVRLDPVGSESSDRIEVVVHDPILPGSLSPVLSPCSPPLRSASSRRRLRAR